MLGLELAYGLGLVAIYCVNLQNHCTITAQIPIHNIMTSRLTHSQLRTHKQVSGTWRHIILVYNSQKMRI